MLMLLYSLIVHYSAAETQMDQQPDETIQCRHEPLPVYVQQGETAMEPYKDS
jgi:hypothetical protein